MDKKDLKNAIKPLVRECLTEIFAEMQLEKIVENVVTKTLPKQREEVVPEFSMKQTASERLPVTKVASSVNKRKLIEEKLGVNDEVWKNIYADTATSANPILESNNNSAENVADTELVPESVLESMGLMKDYSKHIGFKEPSQEDTEWQKKREEREKILSKVKRIQ